MFIYCYINNYLFVWLFTIFGLFLNKNSSFIRKKDNPTNLWLCVMYMIIFASSNLLQAPQSTKFFSSRRRKLSQLDVGRRRLILFVDRGVWSTSSWKISNSKIKTSIWKILQNFKISKDIFQCQLSHILSTQNQLRFFVLVYFFRFI